MRARNKGTRPQDTRTPRPRAGRRPTLRLPRDVFVSRDSAAVAIWRNVHEPDPWRLTPAEARAVALALLDHAHKLTGDEPIPLGRRPRRPTSSVAAKSIGGVGRLH